MPSTPESNPAPRAAWSMHLAAIAPAAIILAAFLIRLAGAHSRFLNADEAMHYLFSLQSSFITTYQASLRTAHPPLLIILLHYWGMVSSTEFFLRIPSVIAGTAAGWFLYAWLPRTSVASVWAAGQVGGVAMAAFFWKTHITLIRRVGMVQHVAESYLRGSLFQRGQESALGFVLKSNIRVFRFLFSQGAVAIVG